jgi:hypothetical protein
MPDNFFCKMPEPGRVKPPTGRIKQCWKGHTCSTHSFKKPMAQLEPSYSPSLLPNVVVEFYFAAMHWKYLRCTRYIRGTPCNVWQTFEIQSRNLSQKLVRNKGWTHHWQETWGLVHKRVLCYGEWDRLGILFLQKWSHTGVALFRNQIRHLRAGTNICRSLQRTDIHYVVPYCASGPNKKYTLLFEEQVNSDKGL